jgi:hypothetical protein
MKIEDEELVKIQSEDTPETQKLAVDMASTINLHINRVGPANVLTSVVRLYASLCVAFGVPLEEAVGKLESYYKEIREGGKS